jgi:hypothetical protein
MAKPPINPIAVGQIGAFYEPPTEEEQEPFTPAVPTKREASRRAGTVIDHRWAHKIMGGRKARPNILGLYDESQRLYQTGGELERFVFWKMKLVSLPYEAWVQVVEKADWIEIIDHTRNECWRVPMARARKHAVRYEAGVGPRVGIPIKHWSIWTAKGTCKQEGQG